MEGVNHMALVAVVLAPASCGGGSSGGEGEDGTGARCYFVPEAGVSFNRGGGVDPHAVEVFSDAACTMPEAGGEPLVVAANEMQALDRCGTGRCQRNHRGARH